MKNYWKALWLRVFAPDGKATAEVARIAVLQQAAASRRAEYAEAKQQAETTGNESPPASLSSIRARMADAEAAHTSALQVWENKQSRQKSR